MQNIISKKDYYTKENEFATASVPYADYLEYMQSKAEIENADEYVVWVTGGGDNAKSEGDDDEESSGPCGECAALDGQVFHYLEIPTTHEGCKCGTIPLKYHTRLERLEAEIEKLEKKIELDKFKKSNEIRKNVEEAKKMKYVGVAKRVWFAYKVWPNGEWDYKQGGKKPEMEYAGNFNYGAAGAALGISDEELLRGAGFAQEYLGNSYELQNDHFYGSPPYGDDPIDQQHIQEGIDWYNANYEI